MPPRKFPVRVAQSGAAFRGFALLRFLSASERTQAILPTRRVVHMVRRDRLYPLPISQYPRRTIHGDPAKMTHGAYFSPAPVCFFVSAHGDSARASTPRNWFANGTFCLPARVSPPSENAIGLLPKCPVRAISSPMLVRPLREGESGVAKAESALPTRHRRPTISSPLAPAPPGWENIRGEWAKAELRSEVSRTLVLFPYGRSTPPEKEPRRRRERGAWSDWFAMIGSFSARLLNSSGKLPKATLAE